MKNLLSISSFSNQIQYSHTWDVYWMVLQSVWSNNLLVGDKWLPIITGYFCLCLCSKLGSVLQRAFYGSSGRVSQDTMKNLMFIKFIKHIIKYISKWHSYWMANFWKSKCLLSHLRWPCLSRGTLPADDWTWVLTVPELVTRTSLRDATQCRWRVERKCTHTHTHTK